MKKIPELKTEDEIVEFWNENDTTEYIDWDKAKKISLPNLKKSAKTLSICMPVNMIETFEGFEEGN